MSNIEGEKIIGREQAVGSQLPEKSTEFFRPEEEVRQILKAPTKDRPQKLKEFKEKLENQKEGLAKMQEHLIGEIVKNPDITIESLWKNVESYTTQYGFDKRQMQITRSLLESYKTKHQRLRTTRDKYPDDRVLFEAIFGQPPRGKIQVIEGPMTLYIRIYHPADFAFISSGKHRTGKKVGVQDVASTIPLIGMAIRKTRLPELDGMIIVENTTGPARLVFDPTSRKARIHEEQHVTQYLFEEILRKPMETTYKLALGDNKQDNEQTLRRYFRWQRQLGEDRAKGELLAHLKSGEAAWSTLLDMYIPQWIGGGYDYFAGSIKELTDELVKNVGDEIRPLAEKVAKDVCKKEYNRLLRQGAAAYINLRKRGYNDEQVTAILLPEPLQKWPKVVKRLLDDKERRNAPKT